MPPSPPDPVPPPSDARVFSPGRLRGYRDLRKLDRLQLAQAAQIAPAAIVAYETGTDRPNPPRARHAGRRPADHHRSPARQAERGRLVGVLGGDLREHATHEQRADRHRRHRAAPHPATQPRRR